MFDKIAPLTQRYPHCADMFAMPDVDSVKDMPVTPDTLGNRYDKSNYPIYKDFVSFFVSGVVGVRKFDRNKCHIKYSKYVTISDEAFTVLTLENNWVRWCSMAEDDDWKDSVVPSKWTTSKEKRGAKDTEPGEDNSNVEDDCPQAKRYRGWSSQGIARYNQLFAEVKAEREKQRFEDFEDYCMEQFLEETGEDKKHGGKRKRTEDDKALPSARHELWDDDPQEQATQQQTITTNIPKGLRNLALANTSTSM